MEASRLRTLMMKSRLLPQALCFLSLFLILGVQANAQSCQELAGSSQPIALGNVASLNGFLPFSGNPNSIWNQNISAAPVDPNSANILATITDGGEPSKLHPDFGPDYGIPYVVVDSTTQPFINMNGPTAGPPNTNASQSDDVVEPAPPTAPIEGAQPDCLDWPASEYYFGDTHMLVVDRAQCWLYETYLTTRCDGAYSVTGQSIFDMYYGEQRPWGWTSSDAAGDSVFAGLLKYDEVYNAVHNSQPISHAVRFTVENTKGDRNGGAFVLPATHASAWRPQGDNMAVMGMRIRLKASTNISSFSAENQAIFTALKNYGAILADNGSNMNITGATDSRWNNDDLGNWHGGGSVDCAVATGTEGCYLTAADFDVLQMSPETDNSPDTDPGETYSYMDSASAPYTVEDTILGKTAAGDTITGQPVGTSIIGGLGPEGAVTLGYNCYNDGTNGTVDTGTVNTGCVNTDYSTDTAGPPPAINSFGAYISTGGIPTGSNLCGGTVDPGVPILFTYNVTSSVPVIPGMGNGYNYIDNAGPVRISNSPAAGDGEYLFTTPTATQSYTLYSMNADGMTIGTPCILYVAHSTLPVPVMTPSAGTYSTAINVTISAPGYPLATIYYTSDGTVPTIPYPTSTNSSTQWIYTAPITITSTSASGEQIKAIAVDSAEPSMFGSVPSGVSSAVYVVNSQAATPVISPVSGTYNTDNAPLAVTITDTTVPIDVNQDGDTAVIYYTTDGSAPGGDAYGDTTGTSIACGNPCTANIPAGTITVNAVADAVGYSESPVATVAYKETISYFTVAVAPTALTIDPNGKPVTVSVTVTSLGGYTGKVNLSCSGLPSGNACLFNPAAVTVTASAAGVSTLTISAGQNASLHHGSFPLLPGGATLAVALCFFGFKKRRRLQLIVLLAASVIGLSLFTGCSSTGSVPVTVTVTITGTDSNGLATVNSYVTLTQR